MFLCIFGRINKNRIR